MARGFDWASSGRSSWSPSLEAAAWVPRSNRLRQGSNGAASLDLQGTAGDPGSGTLARQPVAHLGDRAVGVPEHPQGIGDSERIAAGERDKIEDEEKG
ncbi:MAG: hypothetical protein V5A18_09670 [Haloarculaceae archaeon]